MSFSDLSTVTESYCSAVHTYCSTIILSVIITDLFSYRKLYLHLFIVQPATKEVTIHTYHVIQQYLTELLHKQKVYTVKLENYNS